MHHSPEARYDEDLPQFLLHKPRKTMKRVLRGHKSGLNILADCSIPGFQLYCNTSKQLSFELIYRFVF